MSLRSANNGRPLKILILGGYGTFGGRLAHLLAPDPRIALIIAGRSLDKARRFASTLGTATIATAIDRDSGLDAAIDPIAPHIVVDATGPFQRYGDDPYRVVRAALAVGASYLDLADGSAFVEGIGAFDAEARAKGLFVLAGVSSFPVLTTAVVRALAKDLDRIDSVTGGIAPSPYAGVGLNVIRAITGYAGQPIPIVRDGKTATAHAFTETIRYTIAPPGAVPLRNTRFSLVDVPDLVLIPRADPRISSMWMGAGPVPEILHRALNALAWLVRWRLIPTLAPIAKLCFFAINTLRWGEHRGGMFVEVTGASGARPVRRSWHLLAEGSDGPLIPSMAIEAIVLKLLDGERPAPGARPATEALDLGDYDRVFAGRTIVTGRREDEPAPRPLYRDILGDAWHRLPRAIRDMHDLDRTLTASGRAMIEAGPGPLAALVRHIMGFPSAAGDTPVAVTFTEARGVEQWTRTFGGHRFKSTQEAGRGRNRRLLVERFGPIAVAMALVLDGGKLRLVVRRWSAFGIPLPLALAPRGNTYEHVADGHFNFHVEVRLPLIGLVVRYTGWLIPDRTASPPSL